MALAVPRPVTVDFETFKIDGRPAYPPIPVGVSIKRPGEKSRYYAWGHPTGNNCSWGEAYMALLKCWSNKDGILCQNGKFDVDVAEVHMGLKLPLWSSIHDTLFLLFLSDPHQQRLGLKPSAHRLLGMAPTEQGAVRDWLLKHQPVPGIKLSTAEKSEHYWAGYVAYAPGDLVGKYANGDVIRTERLFKLLYPEIVKRKMLGAYNRERELMPILLGIERRGIPVDMGALKRDIVKYNKVHAKVTAWVVKTLRAPKDINLNSGTQLLAALAKAKKIDIKLLPVTAKTKKPSTKKEHLEAAITDKRILAMLKYRTQLGTCLHTFMEPWYITALKSGGRIFTSWNQVKSPKNADESKGARTGRLSSNPNFQNMPKQFQAIFHHEDRTAGLPRCPIKGLPSLPLVRAYIVPEKGHVLIDRDYSQQEPRILAHFEAGKLLEDYLADPWADFHDQVKAQIERATGRKYTRKAIKTINLGLIYGMGIAKMAKACGLGLDETKELKKAIMALYPGLEELYFDMRFRAANNRPFRTWGGRQVYCEPSRIDEETGRLKTYDYRMVNYLIQGSAADCTKQAIIDYDKAKPSIDLLYLIAHDELLTSTPKARIRPAMEVMRKSMEGAKFDVQMLSEGSWSPRNWASLKTYDKKGKIKCRV